MHRGLAAKAGCMAHRADAPNATAQFGLREILWYHAAERHGALHSGSPPLATRCRFSISVVRVRVLETRGPTESTVTQWQQSYQQQSCPIECHRQRGDWVGCGRTRSPAEDAAVYGMKETLCREPEAAPGSWPALPTLNFVLRVFRATAACQSWRSHIGRLSRSHILCVHDPFALFDEYEPVCGDILQCLAITIRPADCHGVRAVTLAQPEVQSQVVDGVVA